MHDDRRSDLEEKETKMEEQERVSESEQEHGRFRFLKGFVAGAACMAAVTVIGACVTFAGFSVRSKRAAQQTQNQEDTQTQMVQVIENEAGIDFTRVSLKLQLLQAYLDQYYLYEEDSETVEDQIYKGLINGILEDDPYAAYYTAEELEDFVESSSGAYCGIGVLATQFADTKEILVVRVYEGSPAQEAGFLPGDVLYQVSGIDVRQMDLDYVVNNMIRGEEGSFVDITVIREGEDAPVTLHCERRVVETPAVTHHLLEDGTGYVGVVQFSEVAENQFKEAVENLLEEGMERLVIDLRGNPGGSVQTATGMLDYILPDTLTSFTEDRDEFEQGKTLLVYMKNKRDENMAFYGGDGHELSIPIAVLIDETSASASELFAGCLQDYGVAEIVGTTSYGKGIAQTTFMLQDGSAVEFTTENYYTPSGYSVHKKGILPDVEVELSEEVAQKVVISWEEDNQLQAAIQALKD